MNKFTWTGGESELSALETGLTEILSPPADAVSLIKTDPVRGDADGWTLEAYFNEEPDSDALIRLAGALGAPTIEEIPDGIDWVAHSLDGLGVVSAGRFRLYGVHDADKVTSDRDVIPIRIDANMAFGTGHHPTTAGCLTLLDRLAGMAPQSILDLGCGSAVLAIAAAKLWNRDVLATDIDAESVRIAAQNAALNKVGERLSFVEAAGFDHVDIFEAAPFDFVFANILAGPLTELAPAMAAHTTRSARVMLAGLMAEQEAQVAAAYEKEGFRRLNRLDHETWPVLLFVKP